MASFFQSSSSSSSSSDIKNDTDITENEPWIEKYRPLKLEDVIADDDALDGWMIYQKQENEKQKREKGVDSMLTGKTKNSSEVFLMAGNKDQAQDVLGLNSSQSLGQIKQKIDFVKASDKPVRDGQLPDVKQKILEQLNKGK